ncbi:MAG TPA: biotin/lipoyl-containing protein [Bradyrhizobium sp.]|uniref:acetyl-CoA carboxylase biotin carboxyl carrier protein n=1 Tax=Bradyrhizobium sp. TaxID=376 RepID=UPI002B5E2DD2|nr:biotin/lipoyl-containing protein [Bradyrhizobium sp.]HLZ00991.1 biotin/lipoyl-containing protein [Bradyrhizobium sp.]
MPIDASHIEHLAKLLEKYSVASIEIEDNEQSLKLVVELGASSPVPAVTSGPNEDGCVVAMADVAGRFLAGHPWRAKPFVEPGQRIEAGAIVGLVKVGLIYAPVLSPADGILDAVLAETGATVGYGTPIARIRPIAGNCSA